MAASKGYTLAELCAVLAVLAIAVAVGLPAAAYVRDAGKAAAGARRMATLLAAQRFKGVARHTTVGLQFLRSASRWSWRPVEDGNGNGLRAAEIGRGVDRVVGPSETLEAGTPGVTLGIPDGGPYPEAPPGTGRITSADDPVRFGRTTLVAFDPQGSASSGTLYVTDGHDGFYAVVLFGPTARTRVWRFDPGTGRWTR